MTASKTTKPNASQNPDEAEAARVLDGDSHYDGSDMDRAAKDAEGRNGHDKPVEKPLADTPRK